MNTAASDKLNSLLAGANQKAIDQVEQQIDDLVSALADLVAQCNQYANEDNADIPETAFAMSVLAKLGVGTNAGCDKCGTLDRVEGSKFCAACQEEGGME